MVWNKGNLSDCKSCSNRGVYFHLFHNIHYVIVSSTYLRKSVIGLYQPVHLNFFHIIWRFDTQNLFDAQICWFCSKLIRFVLQIESIRLCSTFHIGLACFKRWQTKFWVTDEFESLAFQVLITHIQGKMLEC